MVENKIETENGASDCEERNEVIRAQGRKRAQNRIFQKIVTKEP